MRRVIDRIKCSLGKHDYRISRFVWLGSPPGYRDAFCDRCNKYKSIPPNDMMEARK